MTKKVSGLDPIVTDHAILRYLERAHGLNIDHFRAHIAGLCSNGVRLGARSVIVEDVKFVLNGGSVVTVLERRWVAHDVDTGDSI